ncbi:hypothetical protein A3Q56_03431 [Intoshia linei]|uniref:Uncharacterized protein n=1 Tax=Intoshia linei TaxID=1819745 RepID=A0A177B3G2_9BILA|nr:hypothetical protein A3Q56_03431 [Intoshia linei]
MNIVNKFFFYSSSLLLTITGTQWVHMKYLPLKGLEDEIDELEKEIKRKYA